MTAAERGASGNARPVATVCQSAQVTTQGLAGVGVASVSVNVSPISARARCVSGERREGHEAVHHAVVAGRERRRRRRDAPHTPRLRRAAGRTRQSRASPAATTRATRRGSATRYRFALLASVAQVLVPVIPHLVALEDVRLSRPTMRRRVEREVDDRVDQHLQRQRGPPHHAPSTPRRPRGCRPRCRRPRRDGTDRHRSRPGAERARQPPRTHSSTPTGNLCSGASR